MSHNFNDSAHLFAIAMKARRLKASLSQAELSEATGLAFATINQVERGRRTPDLRTLELISSALDSSVELMLSEGRFMANSSEPFRRKVGSRIVELREARGLTRHGLAVAAKVAPSHLKDIESGERAASIDKLHAILTTLGVSAKAFFDVFD